MAIGNEPSQLSLWKRVIRIFLETVFWVCLAVAILSLVILVGFIILWLTGIFKLGNTDFLVLLGVLVSSWVIGDLVDRGIL